MIPGPVHCVSYSSGIGQYILTGGSDRKITLTNPTTATPLQSYTSHGYEVLSLSISPDNSTFASAGGDKLVFHWDVATAKTLRRFEGHFSRINAVTHNDDASVLISGSYDATVRLWDLKSQSRKAVQVLEDAKDSVTSVYVKGCEVLVGSVDGRVRNYDVRMGRCFVDLIGWPVTSVGVTADGNALLVGALDGGIRLMDKVNGGMLQCYRGHVNGDFRVRSCFGEGEKYVITGSEDGWIWVYDLLEGKVVERLKGHEGKVVTCVAYNPGGKRQMVSSGTDGTVVVWGE
ncbi:WD40-repeat-containing domain protein [Tuber indicum]|nr:WD40-repeat-containing domain protein [Tuber indicum]